jgi:hypothetical protein
MLYRHLVLAGLYGGKQNGLSWVRCVSLGGKHGFRVGQGIDTVPTTSRGNSYYPSGPTTGLYCFVLLGPTVILTYKRHREFQDSSRGGRHSRKYGDGSEQPTSQLHTHSSRERILRRSEISSERKRCGCCEVNRLVVFGSLTVDLTVFG